MKRTAESALLTDLYQLTMAYGYWKENRCGDEAVFHLYFRGAPFGNGFALAAGLEQVVDFVRGFSFDREDLDYLATLHGNDGHALFDPEFLVMLGNLRFSGDIDAVPEGTAMFGNEPLLRVKAPLIEGQLLETALLNLVNFPTLIATKAARIVEAAGGDPVMEFGLRRAQGCDGGLTASRSAYLGGCVGTSNLLAGQRFGIPVKGTHAHSWVMSFNTEPEAFGAYANALPNNCVFLVDTYDTVEGVKHAIAEGRRLRALGHEMVGIRLDSGDLAKLSIAARELLDGAGFENAQIVASNDIDEAVIHSLKEQGARIDVWGIGTKLVTAFDQPALGGVYKLGAIRREGEKDWSYRVKFSDSPGKTSIPGIQQVRRSDSGKDVIYCENLGSPGEAGKDLLQPVFRAGEQISDIPKLEKARRFAKNQWEEFSGRPSDYPVEIERELNVHREKLIAENERS